MVNTVITNPKRTRPSWWETGNLFSRGTLHGNFHSQIDLEMPMKDALVVHFDVVIDMIPKYGANPDVSIFDFIHED